MTAWDETRTQVRWLFLQRAGSAQQLADEIHIGRRTLYNILETTNEPRPSVRAAIETFVRAKCRNARSKDDSTGD